MLIIRRSKLYYTASGIITPVGGRPVHRLRESKTSKQINVNIVHLLEIYIVKSYKLHGTYIKIEVLVPCANS